MLPSPARAQIEEVIVTAQKRKESVQEVPIAVTAFDQSTLKAQQISTFGDVRFAAPNVAYTKDNFTGNNFQIRGIGTSVIAAAYDDGVGIHVNEVPIWYPRLFETEYFDIEQIAILRGPQGTLYGRNSTGGAVNMITKTAQTGETEGYVEGQYGDYDHTQFEGALNVPLGDSFALRFAGLYLERDGYTDNVYTGNDVDGRDQYSVRGSLRWEPGENTTIDLMASYFDEDSSRTRSQKQLCKNDPSGLLGCLPDELAYGTVNPIAQLTGLLPSQLGPLGPQPALTNDPSENPRNLRKVYADFDPTYEADETLVTLRLEHAFENYTLTAVAGYQDTSVLSQQDYNWNVSPEASVSPLMPFIAPKTYATFFADGCLPISAPSKNATGLVGGHIADCGSRLDAYDQSNQDTDQHSIEVRIASNYAGPLNFLAGGFYMEADTEQQYWIMATGLDYFSVVLPAVPLAFGGPVGIDGLGFVSPNFVINTKSYQLESSAVFGELYYDLSDELKLTLGARYTVDDKNIEDVQYLFNTVVPFGFDDEIPIPNREDDE
jgi:outer membrane receptor protein involved in Fe transport